MVTRNTVSPVLNAAIGCLIGFYVLSKISFGMKSIVGLIFLVLICLVQVIIKFPINNTGVNICNTKLFFRYLISFAIGICIGLCSSENVNNKLNFGIPKENIRTINGILLEDPREYSEGRIIANVKLINVIGDKKQKINANGELNIYFPQINNKRLKEFGRGCYISCDGIIKETNFGNIVFISKSLHIIKHASHFEQFRTNIRNIITMRFNSNELKINWSGLSLALLLGIKDNLDINIAGLYRDAGCSYILALSGMHLTIISAIIAFIFKRPLGKRASAISSIILIICYCILVGPMPSLYRAVIMYIIGIFAVLNDLKKEALILLCMAFIIQIIITPQSGYSVSFILSYLALAGILILGDYIIVLFRGKVPEYLLGPLSASIGAFIFSAGITAYYFDILRPIGIVTGLIVIPLTTIFMIGSIIWLLFDYTIPLFSVQFSKILSVIYKTMEKIVYTAGKAPGLNINSVLFVILVSIGLITIITISTYRINIWKKQIPNLI